MIKTTTTATTTTTAEVVVVVVEKAGAAESMLGPRLLIISLHQLPVEAEVFKLLSAPQTSTSTTTPSLAVL